MDVVFAYIEAVDAAGHKYGPGTARSNAAVLGRIFEIWVLLQKRSDKQSMVLSKFDLRCGQTMYHIQGDTSGRTKPPVDIKTKVAFQYMLFILKRNFCFDVNRRFGRVSVSPCIYIVELLIACQ